MNTYSKPKGHDQYSRVSVESDAHEASPHRLIQKLIHGAMEKMAVAKGAIERNDYAAKSRYISWAISIIDGLRMSLDMEAGGEIAKNLESLYDYMSRRLYEANTNNDTAIIDEVSGLMREIQEAWDGIADEVNEEPTASQQEGGGPGSHISIGV
jgi:flagellar protein FliS